MAENQTLKSWCFQDIRQPVSLRATSQWVSSEDPMLPCVQPITYFWGIGLRFHRVQGLMLASHCIISDVVKAGFKLTQSSFLSLGSLAVSLMTCLAALPSYNRRVYEAQTRVLHEKILHKRGYSNVDMKRYSSLLVIRNMQIKTKMSYYSIPIRKTKLKRLTVSSIDKDVEKVGLIHFCWEYKLVQLLGKY